MKVMKYAGIAFLCGLISLGVSVQAAPSLKSMSDEELAQTQGQGLMNLSYLAPTDAGNYESGNNIGFYKLGMEAEVELNANIKKLQLGCGGVNGANGCDIDIDNLSLSGNFDTREGRASSSAKLINPFIEFAIKDPNSASTREVTGFRVSAERATGLLTAGTENSTTPNGINSLSGYIKVQSDSSGLIKGLASTSAGFFDAGVYQVYGTLQALGLGGAAEVDFKTVGGGFNIPAMNNLPFQAAGLTVNGKRISALPIYTTIAVPSIKLDPSYPSSGQVTYNTNTPPNPTGVQTQGGPVVAEVTECRGVACLVAQSGDRFNNVQLIGDITGINADVTINQSLGYIHSLPINSPFYLGLQKQNLRWPGTNSDDTAQRGWWLSLSDPVNLGSVIPVQKIDISPLFPQIASAVSNYLSSNPAQTSDLDGLLLGQQLDVQVGTLNLSGSPLTLVLSDLQLAGQNFAANCYGSLTFC